MKWGQSFVKGVLFHTAAAPWAIENAVHGHELTLVQDCISFNPAWKSALKAMHLTEDISGSRTFRKRRDLLTWMFRKRRECEQRLSDFLKHFLQTVTMKGKDHSETQRAKEVLSFSQCSFHTSLAPVGFKIELLKCCDVHSQSKLRKYSLKDNLPGSPVVRTPCFHCRGHGFDPWSRN